MVSQRSWVQILHGPEFFSGLIFTTAQVAFITAKIAFIFTFLSAFHIAQLVEHCIGIAEVMGSNPAQS